MNSAGTEVIGGYNLSAGGDSGVLVSGRRTAWVRPCDLLGEEQGVGVLCYLPDARPLGLGGLRHLQVRPTPPVET